MSRPITLFTGQWADLPFEEVCRLAVGVGLRRPGDRLLGRPLRRRPGARRRRLRRRASWSCSDKYGLKVWAISNHLVGQAVCDDPIDERHRDILPARIWGDGDPEGVRQRAAEEMKDTARAAAKLGVNTVVGFTGSSIWNYVAMFPPVPAR